MLGDNGIGKTTLVRIAIGRLHADSGTISPAPDGLVAGYCPQDTDENPENLNDFANDWSPETLAIRRDLGIGDDWPAGRHPVGRRSQRLQIACAMALRPDVLVLDEPTNHVDRPTREHINAALRSFPGIGILVSHDVALIDAVAGSCAFPNATMCAAATRPWCAPGPATIPPRGQRRLRPVVRGRRAAQRPARVRARHGGQNAAQA